MLRGPMYAGGAWHTKELVPIEDKAVHDSQLENGLTKDVLGHLQSGAAYHACSARMHESDIGVGISQCVHVA